MTKEITPTFCDAAGCELGGECPPGDRQSWVHVKHGSDRYVFCGDHCLFAWVDAMRRAYQDRYAAQTTRRRTPLTSSAY